MQVAPQLGEIAMKDTTYLPRTTAVALCLSLISLVFASGILAQVDPVHQRFSDALMNGDVRQLDNLLQSGADPNTRDSRGIPALSLAAANGWNGVVNLLIAKGALVNARLLKEPTFGYKGNQGETALHAAAEGGHPTTVDILLKKDAEVNAQDAHGETALHAAARLSWIGSGDNYAAVVSTLIKHGAAVDGQDHDGATPLMYAAKAGNYDAVRAIIASGAITGLMLQTARSIAENEKHPAAVAALEGKPMPHLFNGFPPLTRAAATADLVQVRLLLKSGISPDGDADIVWGSALYWAAEKGFSGIAEILVGAGANVDSRDLNGRTPMYGAVSSGNVKLVKLLVSHGASLRSEDTTTGSFLGTAVHFRNPVMCKLLLDKGLDPNGNSGFFGKPILHEAALQGDVGLVKLLLDHGARINQADNQGRTALFVALRDGNYEAAELLKSRGAQ